MAVTGTNLSLKLVIGADGTIAYREINGVTNAVQGMGKEVETVGAGFGGLTNKLVGLGVGLVAVNQITSAVGAWTAASNVQARAEAQLQHTMTTVAKASQAEIDALKAQAGALQNLTGYGDEATIQAQAFLGTFGLTAQGVATLTPRLLDLAESQRRAGNTGVDLQAIAQKIGKAFADKSAAGLREYGVTLTKVQEEQLNAATGMDKVAALAAVLDANFGGLAASVGGTYEGAMRKAADAEGDLQEVLGDLITKAPAAQAALNGYTGALVSAQEFIKANADGIRELAGDAGLVALIAALSQAITRGTAWVQTQREQAAAAAETAIATQASTAAEARAAAGKVVSAAANVTMAKAMQAQAQATLRNLDALLAENPALAANAKYQEALSLARIGGRAATVGATEAETAYQLALVKSTAASEAAAAAVPKVTGALEGLRTASGALSAGMATMIGYEVGAWMRDAAEGAESWLNPLRYVRSGLDALNSGLGYLSPAFAAAGAAEQHAAEIAERTAATLKKVNEATGLNLQSRKDLEKAVKSGLVVWDQQTETWQRGVEVLHSFAQGMGNLDTAYAKAAKLLGDHAAAGKADAEIESKRITTAAALATALGHQGEALTLTAAAKAADAKAAQDALNNERALLAVAQERLAALARQAPADAQSIDARNAQIAVVTKEVDARRQAAAAAENQAVATDIEARSAQAAALTYGDQSAQLDTLIAARARLLDQQAQIAAASAAGTAAAGQLADAQARLTAVETEYQAELLAGGPRVQELAVAYRDQKGAVQALETAITAGTNADEQAAGVRRNLIIATAQVADAARDAAAAQDILLASMQREATIAAAQADVKLADLARRRDLAAARGEENDAAEYQLDILARERNLLMAGRAAKLAEAQALTEKARLMRIAAEANDEYTAAERAQVDAVSDAAKMAQIEADKLQVGARVKRDQINLIEEVAAKERALAEAFKAAGVIGVKSVQDVQSAARSAATGPELEALGNALRQAFAAGALGAAEYRQALDEVLARQAKLKADALNAPVRTDFEQVFEQFGTDYTRFGRSVATTANPAYGTAMATAYQRWLEQQGAFGEFTPAPGTVAERFAAARQAQAAQAAPAAGQQAQHTQTAPVRVLRFDFGNGKKIDGTFANGADDTLIAHLEQLATVSAR